LSVGARLHGRFEIDEETSMVPELRAMWLHEFGDRDRIVRGRLNGAVTGGDFRVRGAESPRDSALLGLGWAAAAWSTTSPSPSACGSRHLETGSRAHPTTSMWRRTGTALVFGGTFERFAGAAD
jgi:hypothetical protein